MLSSLWDKVGIGAALLSEFDRELAKNRRILARVPDEKLSWRPHDKSSTLAALANHLAAIPIFAAVAIEGSAKRMKDASSSADLLRALDENAAIGRAALAGASDDHLAATLPALNMTRVEVLRERMMSHMIQHRGQLTVYLRLLDIAVPGM